MPQSVLPQLLLPGRRERGDVTAEGRRRLFNFGGGDRGCNWPTLFNVCYPVGGWLWTGIGAVAAPGASGRVGKGFAQGAPASALVASFFVCLFAFPQPLCMGVGTALSPAGF